MGKRAISGRHTPASSRRYTDEFKRDAVALLRSSGRPVAVVARELGVSDITLGAWVRDEERRRGAEESEETAADRAEAARLRKQIKELE